MTQADLRTRVAAWLNAPASEADTAELMFDVAQHLDTLFGDLGSAAPPELSPRLRGALELVTRHPGIQTAQLAGLLGLTHATTNTVVYRLRQAGFVRTEHGRAHSHGRSAHSYPVSEAQA